MMTLNEFVGNWIYWPIVVVVISGTLTWTCNSISILYSEINKQISELNRVKKEDV